MRPTMAPKGRLTPFFFYDAKGEELRRRVACA